MVFGFIFLLLLLFEISISCVFHVFQKKKMELRAYLVLLLFFENCSYYLNLVFIFYFYVFCCFSK